MMNFRMDHIVIALTSLMYLMGSASSVSASEIRGLVIGIDDYWQEKTLYGAVNDANDIEAALREIGASDVVKLTDHQAKRSNIVDEWNDLVSRSNPDDTLIFSYAGHGAQETESIPGNEPDDGRDEVLLLQGFHPTALVSGQRAAKERIRDNELFALLQQASGRNVIVVIDACHSGTSFRSADPRSGHQSYRSGSSYGAIADDPLQGVIHSSREPQTLPADGNIFYLGAIKDHLRVPELPIEGKMRGTLSWAFASALRGRADKNRDGQIDMSELQGHIREQVRFQTHGAQFPSIHPNGAASGIKIAIDARPSHSPVPSFDGLAVYTTPGTPSLQSSDVVEATSDVDAADLIWDPASGDVLAGSGELVAQSITQENSVSAIAEKWLALSRLMKEATQSALDVDLVPNRPVHRLGDRVVVSVSGIKSGTLFLVNLASDGTVQFVSRETVSWATTSSPRDFVTGQVPITRPFGIDHLIAIASSDFPADVEAGIRSLDGSKQPKAFVQTLLNQLDGASFQVGVLPVVTGDVE